MNWKFWQRGEAGGSWALRIAGGVIVIYLVTCLVLGWWWTEEPEPFPVVETAAERAERAGHELVVGYTTTATLAELAETLLTKRGGYLSNDVFPPGVWLDNIPNWEFGVLVQIRDASRAMRIDFSRSQSQSAEDPALAQAEGQFFWDNSSWIFPQTEDEYREGIELLERYLERLAEPGSRARFYARADNLRNWLAGVETRLGSLSQQLSASVGKPQLDVDLAGEPAAARSGEAPAESEVKTPWLEIDDVFYEARGQTWALLHLLRAIEHDFADVLRNKNALVSVEQIIRELEASQAPVFSPIILNGSGFGFLANHSLVMGSYVSRANAALSDLRSLLAQG